MEDLEELSQGTGSSVITVSVAHALEPDLAFLYSGSISARLGHAEESAYAIISINWYTDLQTAGRLVLINDLKVDTLGHGRLLCRASVVGSMIWFDQASTRTAKRGDDEAVGSGVEELSLLYLRAMAADDRKQDDAHVAEWREVDADPEEGSTV